MARRVGVSRLPGREPGAGKTFAMLREGRQRKQRGEDVVIAYVETYGRPRPRASRRPRSDPRKKLAYRGTVLEEMDLDAVLAAAGEDRPGRELAIPTRPAPPREAGGRTWATTATPASTSSRRNVHTSKSVNEFEKITGIVQRETLPDACSILPMRSSSSTLAGGACANGCSTATSTSRTRWKTAGEFLRPGNLAACERDRLAAGRRSRWPLREKSCSSRDVLVAISASAGSEPLIRRAVRLAAAARRAPAVVVTVVQRKREHGRYQRLAAQLGFLRLARGPISARASPRPPAGERAPTS